MIHYFTPYCPDKRLGHIHNYYCSLVPNDDDWICICDPDMMFLRPHTQSRIEEIIKLHGHGWDVLGCMTNRVGVPWQVQVSPGKFSNVYLSGGSVCVQESIEPFTEDSITAHINIAKSVFIENFNTIEETNLVAGFLMLFRKSLWNKIKFQEGINFDIKFCEAVKAQGGRIGIMKGIYVFHLYRFNEPNPKSYKKHLL